MAGRVPASMASRFPSMAARMPSSVNSGFFRPGIYPSDGTDQAGSGSSRSRYSYHCAGRRIWDQDRDFLCGALCYRGSSSAHGVGDCQRTGSLFVWRKSESLFEKRGKAAFRRDLSQSRDRLWIPVPAGQFSGINLENIRCKENLLCVY